MPASPTMQSRVNSTQPMATLRAPHLTFKQRIRTYFLFASCAAVACLGLSSPDSSFDPSPKKFPSLLNCCVAPRFDMLTRARYECSTGDVLLARGGFNATRVRTSSNALPYATDTRVGGMSVAMRVSVDGQRLGSGARRFHLIYLGPTRTALRTCRVAMGCLSGDSRLRRTTSRLRDDLNSLAQNRGRDGRGAGCMRSVGSQASWK